MIAYHIKGNDIFKRDLAILVFLNKAFVDEFRAAAGGEPKYEWFCWSWIKGLDTVLHIFSTRSWQIKWELVSLTDDILRHVV